MHATREDDCAGAFVGDGTYRGDGGRQLQRLWALASWREIRRCPGRYVSSDAILRQVPPDALARRVAQTPISATNSGGGDGDGHEGDGDGTALVERLARAPLAPVVCMLRLDDLAGKDPVVVVCLAGGGGLLTYVKREATAAQHRPDGPPLTAAAAAADDAAAETHAAAVAATRVVFVHTLNTESGLLRKVDALRCGGRLLAQCMPPPSVAAGGGGGSRRAVFAVLLRVLTFLTDAEKNAATHRLVCWAWGVVRRLRLGAVVAPQVEL